MKTVKAFVIIGMLLVSLVLPFVTVRPAYATDPPDSRPTISNVHAFRNLKETGDVAIFGEYRIPYTVIPDEPSSSTYMIILVDSTGNETGFTVPYAFFDFGYNLGAWGMYFEAADNFTWGADYTIRIAQSPAYFTAPENFDYEMSSTAWTSSTSEEDNQLELAIAVIATAERMEAEYTDYTLLEAGLTGTVLYSPTGENYFRNVMNGLQVLAPTLFLYQIIPYDTDIPEYGTNMSDNYTGRFTGTFIGDEVTATGNQFGLTGTAVMAMGFSFPIGLAFTIVSAKKFHKIEPGLLVFALIIMVTYMMGWMPPAIFATVYQCMGVYLAYVWFLARG